MLRGHVFKFQTFANEAFAHFIHTFLREKIGVTKGCLVTNTTSSVSIGAGYFCIYGRFLEIVGDETISNITNTGYYKLVCEIDLSEINTKTELNQASIKLVRGQSSYPNLVQEDLDNGGDVYQYEFARFRVSDNGITDFTDMRTFLNFSSIYEQIMQEFDAMFDAKSAEADALLQEIQDELDGIEDRSGLLPTRGGTISGDLQIDGDTKTDSLKHLNGTKYFEVLSGSISVPANDEATVELDYPTGFTRENCVLISNGLKVIEDVGYNYVGHYENALSLYSGAFTRMINFKSNKIQLTLVNPTTSQTINANYKLVLMKVV